MRSILNRYRTQLGIIAALMIGFGACALFGPSPARSDDFGRLLGQGAKFVGMKVLIDQFGGQLNDGINGLLNNNNAKVDAATKVVAIISAGNGKYTGAAQVVGPQEAVDKVNTVIQIENSFIGKRFRVKVLIPVEGKDPTHIKRIKGVGVSAVIDVRI